MTQIIISNVIMLNKGCSCENTGISLIREDTETKDTERPNHDIFCKIKNESFLAIARSKMSCFSVTMIKYVGKST